jgi:hypothetical protein
MKNKEGLLYMNPLNNILYADITTAIESPTQQVKILQQPNAIFYGFYEIVVHLQFIKGVLQSGSTRTLSVFTVR